ncbi:MAG: superoxide dismutase family protein [Pseudomonadota bacterium]
MFRTLAALVAASLALSACAVVNVSDNTFAEPPRYDTTVPKIEAGIVGVDGETIGLVRLTQAPVGVLGDVKLEPGSITPGWHGLHLHQVGDCSDIGTFKLSGGHLGLIPDGHGLLNPIGPEAGDLPNLYAFADGSATMEFFTTLTSLSSIADADGSALIIHQNRDDHITQPIGGAGPRVGCAVLK